MSGRISGILRIKSILRIQRVLGRLLGDSGEVSEISAISSRVLCISGQISGVIGLLISRILSQVPENFTADFKDIRKHCRKFTSDFNDFKPDFRDFRDFRTDFREKTSDFWTFVHRTTEVVGTSFSKPCTTASFQAE